MAKAKWLQKQSSELLPVGYFHVVFTLPHVLNGLILAHKRFCSLFCLKPSVKRCLSLAKDVLRERWGSSRCCTSFDCAQDRLWDQKLQDHFHLHCVIPAGALSFDHHRWIAARKNFLFPVIALSQVFRGKFLDLLRRACHREKIEITSEGLKQLRQKDWVVYAKKPFGSPQTVLDYLPSCRSIQ